MNSLALAFVGDAVFDLFVRERLVSSIHSPVGVLNNLKVQTVCCKSQAKAVRELLPKLTEEELMVYKRGRNTKVSSVPKNAQIADYHAATGLEALFGYLYLKGEMERLKDLLCFCVKEV